MKKLRKNNSTAISPQIIVGLLLILLSLIIFIIYFLYCYHDNAVNIKNIDNYFNNINTDYTDVFIDDFEEEKKDIKTENSTNYIGVLEIPSIDFKRGFLNLEDKNNTIKRNIEVIKGSDMPNVTNGNFILAAHSGKGWNAFFNDLFKIKINDEAYIYFDGEKYIYQVTSIYEIEKNGNLLLKRNLNKTTMTLITCSGNDKQYVVVLERLL